MQSINIISEFTKRYPFTFDGYQIEAFELLNSLVHSSRNGLVVWPTGCGKSSVAEYAIQLAKSMGMRTLTTFPLKALATEKYNEWSEDEDLKVVRDTSDDRSKRNDEYYDDFDVLITTNERLDVILRSPNLRNKVFANVMFLVIDEIHLLGSKGRGSTLEFLIMVMKEMLPDVRLVGLSATLPNYQEFADWLTADYTYLPPEKRPIPLHFHYASPIDHYASAKQSENSKFYQMKNLFERHPSENFLGFCSSRVRTEKLAKRSANFNPRSYLKIADLIKRDVAYHHAGLTESERGEVEFAFRDGKISKIFATPTLAQGVNMPARNVVMFDLSRWSIFTSSHELIEHYEIGQMAGRAGRRGYDNIGRCYFLGKPHELVAAKEAVENPRDMESQIDDWLDDKILALSVSKICQYEQEIIDVFDQSFLIYRNNTDKLKKLIPKNIDFLVKNRFLWREHDGHLSPTSFGRMASKIYVKPKTAVEVYENMMKLGDNPTETEILKAFLKNGELLMQVRVSEMDGNYIDGAKYHFAGYRRSDAVWVNVYNQNRKMYEEMNLTNNFFKILGLVFSEDLGIKVYGSKQELGMMKKIASEMMSKLFLVLKNNKLFAEKFEHLDGKVKIAIEMVKNGILDPEKLKLVLIPNLGTARLNYLSKRNINTLEKFLETDNERLASIMKFKKTEPIEKMKKFAFKELV
jgi:helicase